MKQKMQKILAVVLAVMTVFSFGFSALAADYQIELGFDADELRIIVENTDSENYEYNITPNTGVFKALTVEDSKVQFLYLTAGTEYTVTAHKVRYDSLHNRIVNPEVYASAKMKLLKGQSIPGSPVIVDVTSSTITVKYISGCEVSLDGENWFKFKKDNENYKFEGLTENTQYYVYARKAAVENEFYASKASNYTPIKTKLSSDQTDPGMPVVDAANISSTTITVKAVSGYEYSIGGEKWQKSNKFTDLTPNTVYNVYQRKSVDTEIYEPAKRSAAKVVQTLARDSLKANADEGSVAIASVHAGTKCTVTCKIVFPASTLNGIRKNVYGDTKLTPIYFKSDLEGNATYELKTEDGNSYEGSFIPSVDGKHTLTIYYKREKYDGINKWIDDGIVTGQKTVTITPKQNFFEKVAEVLGNLILNDIPEFLAKVGTWIAKIFIFIFGFLASK